MVANHYRWDFIGLSSQPKPTPTNSEKVVDGSTFFEADTSKLYVFCKNQWYEKIVSGGGGGGGVTVVQTTGTSTTDVMSQNAVTSMVYADPSAKEKVQIGARADGSAISATAVGSGSRCSGAYGVALGYSASCGSQESVSCGSGAAVASAAKSSVSIGSGSLTSGQYAISLGSFSNATQKGQMDISTTKNNNTHGYNNSQYRLLTGLYDGQSAHDAVTVGQINAVIDAINTAASLNISHIGA